MLRRALLPAVALVATIAACSDDGGPAGTVPPTGTYTIALTHGTLPGGASGTTAYTGTMVLTGTGAERVQGSWQLQRTFTPAAGPPSQGLHSDDAITPGTFDGEVYALDAATTPGTTLRIRFVPSGNVMTCRATVAVQPAGGGAEQTAAATCTIGYQG